jgi:hypothetical protein
LGPVRGEWLAFWSAAPSQSGFAAAGLPIGTVVPEAVCRLRFRPDGYPVLSRNFLLSPVPLMIVKNQTVQKKSNPRNVQLNGGHMRITWTGKRLFRRLCRFIGDNDA